MPMNGLRRNDDAMKNCGWYHYHLFLIQGDNFGRSSLVMSFNIPTSLTWET